MPPRPFEGSAARRLADTLEQQTDRITPEAPPISQPRRRERPVQSAPSQAETGTTDPVEAAGRAMQRFNATFHAAENSGRMNSEMHEDTVRQLRQARALLELRRIEMMHSDEGLSAKRREENQRETERIWNLLQRVEHMLEISNQHPDEALEAYTRDNRAEQARAVIDNIQHELTAAQVEAGNLAARLENEYGTSAKEMRAAQSDKTFKGLTRRILYRWTGSKKIFDQWEAAQQKADELQAKIDENEANRKIEEGYRGKAKKRRADDAEQIQLSPEEEAENQRILAETIYTPGQVARGFARDLGAAISPLVESTHDIEERTTRMRHMEAESSLTAEERATLQAELKAGQKEKLTERKISAKERARIEREFRAQRGLAPSATEDLTSQEADWFEEGRGLGQKKMQPMTREELLPFDDEEPAVEEPKTASTQETTSTKEEQPVFDLDSLKDTATVETPKKRVPEHKKTIFDLMVEEGERTAKAKEAVARRMQKMRERTATGATSIEPPPAIIEMGATAERRRGRMEIASIEGAKEYLQADTAAELWELANNHMTPVAKKNIDALEIGKDEPATKFVYLMARLAAARQSGGSRANIAPLQKNAALAAIRLNIGSEPLVKKLLSGEFAGETGTKKEAAEIKIAKNEPERPLFEAKYLKEDTIRELIDLAERNMSPGARVLITTLQPGWSDEGPALNFAYLMDRLAAMQKNDAQKKDAAKMRSKILFIVQRLNIKDEPTIKAILEGKLKGKDQEPPTQPEQSSEATEQGPTELSVGVEVFFRRKSGKIQKGTIARMNDPGLRESKIILEFLDTDGKWKNKGVTRQELEELNDSRNI